MMKRLLGNRKQIHNFETPEGKQSEKKIEMKSNEIFRRGSSKEIKRSTIIEKITERI